MYNNSMSKIMQTYTYGILSGILISAFFLFIVGIGKAKESCLKLDPKAGKEYLIVSGFFKGLTFLAHDYNINTGMVEGRISYSLWFKDITLSCNDLGILKEGK